MAIQTRKWRRRLQDQQVASRRRVDSILERLTFANLLKLQTIKQKNRHHQQQQQQQHNQQRSRGNKLVDYHDEQSCNLLQSFKQDHHLCYIVSTATNGLSLLMDHFTKLAVSPMSSSPSSFSLISTAGTTLNGGGGDTSCTSYGDSDHHHHQRRRRQLDRHRDHHRFEQREQQQRRHKQVANWLRFSSGTIVHDDTKRASEQCWSSSSSSNPSRPLQRSSSKPIFSFWLTLKALPLLLILVLLSLSFVFSFAASSEHSKSAAASAAAAASRPALIASSSLSVVAVKWPSPQPLTPERASFKAQANLLQPFEVLAADSSTGDDALQFEQRLSHRSSSNGGSPLDYISSANLPAEFRGVDLDDESGQVAGALEGQEDAPKEQSKLARLCQQTSNVLASVLPAPFGGHKRSILCQFFGQVPLRTSATNQQHQVAVRPQLAQLPMQQVPPVFNNLQDQQSIAVLHHQTGSGQHQQAPTVFMNSANRHPIQIVLEEQQRQYLTATRGGGNSNAQQLAFANNQQVFGPSLPVQPLDDLKGSASIVDYRYQQKIQAPESIKEAHKSSTNSRLKFSTPVGAAGNAATTTSFKPSTPRKHQVVATSSSGWRIFNQPPFETTQTSFVIMSSTTSAPATNNTHSTTTTTATSSKVVASAAREQQVVLASKPPPSPPVAETTSSTISSANKQVVNQSTTKKSSTVRSVEVSQSTQMLVLGKPPPVFNQQQQVVAKTVPQQQVVGPKQLSIGKRSEALKTTTKASPSTMNTNKSANDEVRIIEVVAQSSSSVPVASPVDQHQSAGKRQLTTASPQTNSNSNSSSSTTTTTTTTSQRPTDLHQVQKREELVIASINNLTRIAFGNQLRDTVKVINKLIDQQSSLFNNNKAKANGLDPLSALESSSMSKKSILNKQQQQQQQQSSSKSDKWLSKSTDSSGEKFATRQKAISAATSVVIEQQKSKKTTKKQLQPTVAPPSSAAKPDKENHLKKASFSSQRKTTTTGGSSSSTGAVRKTIPVEGESRVNRVISNDSASEQQATQRTRSSTTKTTQRFSMKNNNDNDHDHLFPMVAVRDIHRDKSPWQMSNPSSAGGFVPSSPKALISMKPSASSMSTTTTIKRAASATGGSTLPWLLERHSSASDAPVELRKLSSGEAALKKWTAARMLPLSSASSTSYRAGKLAAKLDSLTTLKMSLLNSNQPPTHPSFAGTTQSRWVPTASATGGTSTRSYAATGGSSSSTTPLPTSSSSSSTRADDVTRAMSSSSASSLQPPTTTTELPTSLNLKVASTATTSGATAPTEQQLSINTNTDNDDDLNEARASDSISRFTTTTAQQWNGDGNELLATTRRLFQQPMPQIAQTGEFFSAETISNWPERYQTMMGQALEAAQQTSSSPAAVAVESTRRSGEAYDNTDSTSGSTATTAARHRFEQPPVEQQQQREQRNTRTTLQDLSSLINLPGITVLPANHKLSSTTTAALASDQPQTTVAVATTEQPSEMRRTRLPAPLVAYTLTGPFSDQQADDSEQHTTGAETSVSSTARQKFPQLLTNSDYSATIQQQMSNLDGATAADKLPLNTTSSPLRPPYSELQDSEQSEHLINQTSSSSDRSSASRKLYDLLKTGGVSNGFINGPQIPAQRFNLSALKFLAQSILQQAGISPVASYADDANHTLRDETQDYQGLARQNKIASQQLLDLLGSTSSIPSNYYELLLNETAISPDSTLSGNQQAHTNRTSGKTLLGRAGNLLNDLRQLEQKKAAALMAAIRYQVPSPLVRPWDVVSDLQTISGLVRSPTMNDRRFDNVEEDMTDSERLSRADLLRESLILAQAGRAIKSALRKQRVVPRDELEARLKGGSSKIFRNDDSNDGDSIMSDRRSDGVARPSSASDLSPSYLDETVEYATAINGSRHDHADYVLLNDADFSRSNQNRTSNETKSSWLERLFSLPIGGKTFGNKTHLRKGGDFDLIALSNTSNVLSTETGVQHDESGNNRQASSPFPMYIRMNDYQTASSAKPQTNNLKSERQSLPSSAVAERLRNTLNSVVGRNESSSSLEDNTHHQKINSNAKDQEILERQQQQQQQQEALKKSNDFDCRDKSAGFYPDIDTTCQTFYHCSSTGHLLTFNCPQQTRFDEKSLKCGAWFEVPCDLGRMKLKQYAA